MRSTLTQLYVHVVWATWDRVPLIDARMESVIYPAILNEARSLKADVLAIGGIEDHVHILARIPASISVSEFVRHTKAASSLLCGKAFRWQGAYGAFSVSRSHVARVNSYVQRQREHHANGTLYKSLELDS
ncbi:MAG TPA: transposase [Capsulimonadaceae bacterium]|jgi:REP element-mobilizing transposase RayT